MWLSLVLGDWPFIFLHSSPSPKLLKVGNVNFNNLTLIKSLVIMTERNLKNFSNSEERLAAVSKFRKRPGAQRCASSVVPHSHAQQRRPGVVREMVFPLLKPPSPTRVALSAAISVTEFPNQSSAPCGPPLKVLPLLGAPGDPPLPSASL